MNLVEINDVDCKAAQTIFDFVANRIRAKNFPCYRARPNAGRIW